MQIDRHSVKVVPVPIAPQHAANLLPLDELKAGEYLHILDRRSGDRERQPAGRTPVGRVLEMMMRPPRPHEPGPGCGLATLREREPCWRDVDGVIVKRSKYQIASRDRSCEGDDDHGRQTET